MSLTTSSPAESMADDESIIDASEFDGPDFLTDPYALYRRLRTYHPVYHDRLHNQWHVTRYWDLVEAFRDEEAFGTRPHSYETDGVLGPTMLSLGGAEHAAQRNLVGDALVGKKLDAFTPIVRDVGALTRGDVRRPGAREPHAGVHEPAPHPRNHGDARPPEWTTSCCSSAGTSSS